MPVTAIQSKWDSGNLVFHDKGDYGAGAEILKIAQATVTIGTGTNSVDLSVSNDLLLASGSVINFNSGDVTLTHSTDILKFASSANDTSRGDGYGFFEFDVAMTGTATGHFAATSAWVNIGSGVTPASGGDIITPRTDGIWEDAGATLAGANLAFGARMQAILGDSDFNRLTIWSLNTNQTITAVYDAGSPAGYIGRVTGTPSASAIATIPFIVDSNGDISYIYLYADPA